MSEPEKLIQCPLGPDQHVVESNGNETVLSGKEVGGVKKVHSNGTYIPIQVPAIDKPRYRSRKGDIATNVLGVCDRYEHFVYVLSGWEGSAADGRVLRDAISRENGLKVPTGSYYLCDSGYTNGEGFLTPYRGYKYHLREWKAGNRIAQNYQDSYPELKSSSGSSSRLAIISIYAGQVKLFREKFRSTFGAEFAKVVDINTVDGFQGWEKDLTIFSAVRANENKNIGFVSDFRRMNVGITRARSSILATILRGDVHWKNLTENAEQRNVFFKVSKPYANFFSEASLDSLKVEVAEPEEPEDPLEDTNVAVPVDTVQNEESEYGADDGDEGYNEDYGED
ncbi:hypothetical protein OROGR_012118 [Orobanche gracilis]